MPAYFNLKGIWAVEKHQEQNKVLSIPGQGFPDFQSYRWVRFLPFNFKWYKIPKAFQFQKCFRNTFHRAFV